MVAEPLPLDIQQFLTARVESLVALEALLLVRSEPSRAWEVAEVAARLTVTPAVALRGLSDLQARGLVIDAGSIGWLAIELDADGEALLVRLARIHERDRWLVARYVSGHFFGRLRMMATAFTRGAS